MSRRAWRRTLAVLLLVGFTAALTKRAPPLFMTGQFVEGPYPESDWRLIVRADGTFWAGPRAHTPLAPPDSLSDGFVGVLGGHGWNGEPQAGTWSFAAGVLTLDWRWRHNLGVDAAQPNRLRLRAGLGWIDLGTHRTLRGAFMMRRFRPGGGARGGSGGAHSTAGEWTPPPAPFLRLRMCP